MKNNGADRRPWLIVSRREALALLDVGEDVPKAIRTPDLGRALEVLRRQLRWIGHEPDGEEPDRFGAVLRDG